MSYQLNDPRRSLCCTASSSTVAGVAKDPKDDPKPTPVPTPKPDPTPPPEDPIKYAHYRCSEKKCRGYKIDLRWKLRTVPRSEVFLLLPRMVCQICGCQCEVTDYERESGLTAAPAVTSV